MSEIEPQPVLDLIEAFRRSKAMFTAVSLGIFDQLAPAPSTAPDLAAALHLNPEAVERLLNACVALGLLARTEDKRYANAAVASRYLVSASPDTLAGYILYSDRSLYPLWGHLDDAVRQGSNRWEQTFGKGETLFDHFFRDEAAKRSFLTGMHGFGRLTSHRVARAFDLSGFRHLVDLGGATGHLSIAACQTYAGLTATVFDLPPVASFAREQIARAAMQDRVRFVEGDFFRDRLPAGDLYALGRILHDWNQEKIDRLLGKILDALPPGGALLIAETLVSDGGVASLPALMQDLNMLVCTEGRERTCSEYRNLLETAGFHSVECRQTGVPLDAVLARKP